MADYEAKNPRPRLTQFFDEHVHPEKGLMLAGFAVLTVHRVFSTDGGEGKKETETVEVGAARSLPHAVDVRVLGPGGKGFFPHQQAKTADRVVGFVHPLVAAEMDGEVTLEFSFPEGGPDGCALPEQQVTFEWSQLEPRRISPDNAASRCDPEPVRIEVPPHNDKEPDVWRVESIELSAVTASLLDKPVESLELALSSGVEEFFDAKPVINFYADASGVANWANWGCTFSAKPVHIFSNDADGQAAVCPSGNKAPRTVADLEHIVGLAASQNLKVRTFGSGHSWTPYTATEGILVDTREIFWDPAEGRGTIEMPQQASDGRWLCRFSPGVTTGQLEHTLWSMGSGFSLPTSTYEDVFTMGGILSTASHGTGVEAMTLSDWVDSVEIVSANGQLTTFKPGDPVPGWVAANDPTLTNADIMAALRCSLGALGIVHAITMEVKPRYYSFWVTETYPIEEFFADTDEARSNLYQLQQQWDSLEFFYLPGHITLLGVEAADHVVCLQIRKEERGLPPRDYKNPGGATYQTPNWTDAEYDEYWQARGAVQAIGTRLIQPLMKAALVNEDLHGLIELIVGIQVIGFPPTPEGICWKLRQWQANHTVNAAGAVEPMRAVDIEWAVPFKMVDPTTQPSGTTGADKGMWGPNVVMGHLIDKVRAAWNKYPEWQFWNKWKTDRFPVTIAAEMRLFKASKDVLLSPESSWGDFEYFAAPEIVSHTATPAWEEFMTDMHHDIVALPGLRVKTHIAKQGWEIEHHMGWLREQFRLLPWGASNQFDVFQQVRAAFDPNGNFLSPMLEAWLATQGNTLGLDPSKFPLTATGYVHLPDGTPLEDEDMFPHDKQFP